MVLTLTNSGRNYGSEGFSNVASCGGSAGVARVREMRLTISGVPRAGSDDISSSSEVRS